MSDLLFEEGLAVCNNYLHTGQKQRAMELIAQLKTIVPENDILLALENMDVANPPIELLDEFGRNWNGEHLVGESLEVFADQGMGDLINMLRYLYRIKELWRCRIVLNCYAHYDEFWRLLISIPYIDQFTNHHVRCTYHTNILSVPAIIYRIPFRYPLAVEWLGKIKPLAQPEINIKRRVKVGVAWQSNALNDALGAMKSMEVVDLRTLVDADYEFYSLLPTETSAEFLRRTVIRDLYDTACLIKTMDVVISVDTAVLHLAGAMGKKTIGLLCKEHDPRWQRSDWYPNLKLFRQETQGDWSVPLRQVKQYLEEYKQWLPE